MLGERAEPPCGIARRPAYKTGKRGGKVHRARKVASCDSLYVSILFPDTKLGFVVLSGRRQPIGLKPGRLGSKGVATLIERSEPWTIDRRKIREPASVLVGFDV